MTKPDFPTYPDMVPQTIFAIRAKTGWRVLSWKCLPDELEERLRENGVSGASHRFIAFHHVHEKYIDRFIDLYAHKAGWHKDEKTDAWFPIEESFPVSFSGDPVASDITLSLNWIAIGHISFMLRSVFGQTEFVIDDFNDNLLLLPQFARLLREGDCPHAALSDNARTHFFVKNFSAPDICRLIVKRERNEDDVSLDILVNRAHLTNQFAQLAASIADHPCFALSFLFNTGLSDELHEAVYLAAEADWEAGVKQGKYSDDLDAYYDYEAHRLSAEIPLSDDQSTYAETYRNILKSLIIPDGFS